MYMYQYIWRLRVYLIMQSPINQIKVEFVTINNPGSQIYVPSETSRPALGPNQTPIHTTAVAIIPKVKAVGS